MPPLLAAGAVLMGTALGDYLDAAPTSAVDKPAFHIVDPGDNPLPTTPRRELSVNVGGG